MRLLVAAVLLASVPAAAREAEPQTHEVRVDIDIGVETQANSALVDAQYTFTPSAINRTDEVVPILRRFVRHPSALWVRLHRLGYTRESVTGGSVGGILQLGPAYTSGDIGVQYDVVDYDINEHAYWALPVTAEVGFRPVNLLSVAAFYDGRYVLGASRDDLRVIQAERSGAEHEFGGRVALATPNDRLFLNLSAFGRFVNWTFKEFHPGDLTIRGFAVSAKLAYQLSSSFSLVVRAEGHRDHWVNHREGDDSQSYVGENTDRTVFGATGGIEIFYWHKGRYGFRFGLGGGYEGAPPVVENRETAILQINLGLITRF